MKLSIIIPVYNGEKYLKDCLDSIFKNVDDQIEIIVINDGSTDNTERIIKNYKFFYKIKYYNNKNHGVSYTRNYGLCKSTGDYIMFLDADDVLEENWKKCIDEIKEMYDIVYFTNCNIDNNLVNYIIGNNKDNKCIAGPWSKLFSKTFLENNKLLFNEELINGEDMLFNLLAFFKSKNIKVVNEEFYYYREHLGSVTKRFDKKIFENDTNFHLEIKKLKDIVSDATLVKQIETFCLTNAIIIIYDRISYIDKYKNAIKEIDLLYNTPYNQVSFITGVKVIKNLKSKIKFLLYKMRFKKILFYLFKINHKKSKL